MADDLRADVPRIALPADSDDDKPAAVVAGANDTDNNDDVAEPRCAPLPLANAFDALERAVVSAGVLPPLVNGGSAGVASTTSIGAPSSDSKSRGVDGTLLGEGEIDRTANACDKIMHECNHTHKAVQYRKAYRASIRLVELDRSERVPMQLGRKRIIREHLMIGSSLRRAAMLVKNQAKRKMVPTTVKATCVCMQNAHVRVAQRNRLAIDHCVHGH